MSLFRLNRYGILFPRLSQFSKHSSSLARKSEEYTDTPLYPKIYDTSKSSVKERENLEYHEVIKGIGTVEEKLFKINMPRFYGWSTVFLKENDLSIQSLPFAQHSTRTHFVQKDTLPEHYVAYESPADFIAKNIRSEIEDAIAFEYQGVDRHQEYSLENSIQMQKDDFRATNVIKHVNRIITNHLSSDLTHIMEAQMDIKPRIEAFWFAGGFIPKPKSEFRNKFLLRLQERSRGEVVTERKDHPMQFFGDAALTLRSDLPLEPFLPYNEATSESLEVPLYEYDPRTVAYEKHFRHGTSIPGFWPGDTHEYGLLSYHTRGHLIQRPETYGPEEMVEILHTQGLFSSYAWLLAQACYQGFSTFNDITYPLTTQTVVTDGQSWSFYTYQLNTLLVHGNNIKTNPLRNVCYGTQPMKLFESIDDSGKVIGFNENVLKVLLQFYLNTPKKREDIEMKPYLEKDVKVIADIEDEPRREWLEKHYKHLVSNRPRHLLPYEIYQWETIYKIRHDTRFREAKKRPFELHQNPLDRKLNQHHPVYIPKVIRPGGPKNRDKWYKTYYP